MRKYLPTFIFFCCCCIAQSNLAATAELHVTYVYGQESMGKILREFGTSTGIPIKVEFIEQNNLKSQLITSVEFNTTPDAIIVPADHVGLYNFIKYSEVNPATFKAKIADRLWGSGLSDGKLYGVPFIQGNHLMLYYNKSLVKEPAHDWQAMLAQKAQFDTKGIATVTWSVDEPFWFLPFLGAFGGWPLTDGKVSLNTPAMVAALDFYKDIRSKLLYPNCDYKCSTDLFKAGKVAYTVNGEWEGTHFAEALGANLGVSAIPKAQGNEMVSSFSTYVVAFPNDSLNNEKRASLIQLVNYLQSTKVQQQIWDSAGAIPVDTAAFKYAQKNAKGYLKQTLELMVYTKPLPADEAMSFIWDAFRKGFIRYQEGALDSKGTALFMQTLVEHNIRNAERSKAPLP